MPDPLIHGCHHYKAHGPGSRCNSLYRSLLNKPTNRQHRLPLHQKYLHGPHKTLEAQSQTSLLRPDLNQYPSLASHSNADLQGGFCCLLGR